jgi:hypothetical protein
LLFNLYWAHVYTIEGLGAGTRQAKDLSRLAKGGSGLSPLKSEHPEVEIDEVLIYQKKIYK